MRLCISGRILEGMDERPGIEEFVAMAKRAGYDGVGLRPWQVPPDASAQDIDTLQRALDDSGLSVSSIMTKSDVVEQVLPVARALGVTVLQIDKNFAEVAGLLDADMRLGPQMHTGGEFETVASAAEALDKLNSPKVGVIAEPANHMLAGEAWRDDLFAPLAGRIIGCNAQSIVVGRGAGSLKLSDGTAVACERVPWAENDQADLGGFFRALRAAGYDDYVNMLEVAPKDVPLEQFAANCANFLRPFVSQ